MGFFSRAFLVFLTEESKKTKTAGQIHGEVLFTAGQFAQCLALNEPPAKLKIEALEQAHNSNPSCKIHYLPHIRF